VLGSTGYPFEKYIAQLLRYQGYIANNNQIIKGFCVSHEVDVTAEKKEKLIFVECKYHNKLGIRCDVKISLYFKARFMDIEQGYVNSINDNPLILERLRIPKSRQATLIKQCQTLCSGL